MKKIIITICMALFIGISVFAADATQGIVVKPIGFVTAAKDGAMDINWNSIDPQTDSRFLFKKVDGESNLYTLEMTLNKLYRTSKWLPKHGTEAPTDGVANEGWSEFYTFQVVYKDEYINPAVSSQTARKAFKVPADRTKVTFYAKIVDGKIYSVCDAQEFVFGANEAGEGQGNILSAIGQLCTSKSIDTYNENKNSDQPNANILAQNTNNSFSGLQTGKNDDFGGKLKLYDTTNGGKRGRVIITLHYNTISFTAEKSIDAIQGVTGTIKDGQNLGTISKLNIPFIASLNTVATKGEKYPLPSVISEKNVSVNLCCQFIKGGNESGKEVIIKKPFAIQNGATNLSASWILEQSNLLDGQELENGDYSLKFWYEAVYIGEYGKDTIIYNNGDTNKPFVANFTLNVPVNANELSSNELERLAANELNTKEWLIIKGDMDDIKLAALQKALGNNNIITSIRFKEGNFSTEINTNYFVDINPNCLIYVPANVSSTAIKNLIVDGNAKEITITDRYPFNCPEMFNSESIFYTRNCYTDNGWETIFLPFDVTSISLVGSEIRTLKEKDANGNLIFEEASSISANIAYIISFPGNIGAKADCVFSGSGIIKETVESIDNILIGTYKDRDAKGDFILNQDGQFFGKAVDGVKVWGFRAYISGETSIAQRLKVIFENASGIKSVLTNMIYSVDGIIYLGYKQKVSVFNTNGSKVYESVDTDHIEGLPNGIYVVNGQKVVVK